MLAPGGLLLLIEETKFYPFFDLGMGLQQGFDGREDEDFRPAHPLLEREQWNALFQELRFATSATLVSSESPADVLGFDVIVAQAPSRALELNCAALAAFLERTLPSYVVPRQYTVLDRMPLGKNGKVDRGALPASAPAAQETIEFVAPRTETEHELAEILRVVLNVPKVGMRDQFLRLGGDSLLAAKVALSIRKKYGINFPIRALFEADVANLAQLIGAARANVDRDASVAVVGEI
jgi:pyochelin synthetase